MNTSATDLSADHHRRTNELKALVASASDLSSLRDVDEVLTAIVQRARELLATDVAYLMLIDAERQDAYMRTSVGTQGVDWMSIRLNIGEGIGGLIAATGTPHWTADLMQDELLTRSIGGILEAEGIVAMLGVPLKTVGEVIGVLFAADRRARNFSHEEVALLGSLADHSAIALENARLFEQREESLEQMRIANQRAAAYGARLERSSAMHERLTELVATGASLDELATVVGEGLGGRAFILDPNGAALTSIPPDIELSSIQRVLASGQSGVTDEGLQVGAAAINTNSRELGALIHTGVSIDAANMRALERAAMVTALLLLDERVHEDAIERLMSDVLADLAEPGNAHAERARTRAADAGLAIPDTQSVMIAVVAAVLGDETELSRHLVAFAHKRSGLAGMMGGHMVAAIPSDDAGKLAREASRAIGESLGFKVTVGAVGPFDTVREAVLASTDAIACAKLLVTLGRTGAGATPEELGPYALLFSDVARLQIESFINSAIGAVRAYDKSKGADLLRTVGAYFDTLGQPTRAAEDLHIHVNTFYQRLERVDSLLGAEWRRGEQALLVHLALRLATLLEADGDGRVGGLRRRRRMGEST